jgi:hypothetical protein
MWPYINCISGTVGDLKHVLVSGYYGGGTITNCYGIHIQNATGSATITSKYGIYINAQTGGSYINWDICAAGNSYIYNLYTHDGGVHSSDADLKRDIADCETGLSFVTSVRPVQFRWIDHDYTENYQDENNEIQQKVIHRTFKRLHFGFLAQEIKAELDNRGISTEDFAAYIDDPNVGKAIRSSELIPILWQAVREQDKKIQDLEKRLAALEAKLG